MHTSISVLGFNLFNGDLSEINFHERRVLLNTMSPNSFGITTKDTLFRNALKYSDVLVLDGVYFALASLLLKGENIKRNQGPDVFYHFMEMMNRSKGKVFFLGSTDATLVQIKNKTAIQYPNIRVDYYSPPFANEFTEHQNIEILEAINNFEPDVLFVGMTCPKQEKWSYLNQSKLKVKLICCIGGVFDWYAGNQKTIAPIWWKLRLAWLKRMIDRPEIFKRNMPNIFIFCKYLILAFIGIKKYRNGEF